MGDGFYWLGKEFDTSGKLCTRWILAFIVVMFVLTTKNAESTKKGWFIDNGLVKDLIGTLYYYKQNKVIK